jgi:hypothetical protein
MNKFKWGNMETEGQIYLQENDLRMTTNLRLQIATLASALADEGRKDDGKKVLDLCLEKMPERNVPYDRIMLPVIEAYYDVDDKATAARLTERLFQIMDENITYYMSLDPAMADKISQELEITHAVMGRLTQVIERNDPANPLTAKLKQRMTEVDDTYTGMLEAIDAAGRRTVKMKF